MRSGLLLERGEREIGFKLFDPLSRGVKISSAGRLFLDVFPERRQPPEHSLTHPNQQA